MWRRFAADGSNIGRELEDFIAGMISPPPPPPQASSFRYRKMTMALSGHEYLRASTWLPKP